MLAIDSLCSGKYLYTDATTELCRLKMEGIFLISSNKTHTYIMYSNKNMKDTSMKQTFSLLEHIFCICIM